MALVSMQRNLPLHKYVPQIPSRSQFGQLHKRKREGGEGPMEGKAGEVAQGGLGAGGSCIWRALKVL